MFANGMRLGYVECVIVNKPLTKKERATMKTENMTESGFGRVLELEGFIWIDTFQPEQTEAFFPKGFPLDTRRYRCLGPETLKFQEFQRGGMGRPQYVPHRFAGWKSARVVSESGPGNLHDRSSC
jgi:hypothetical protein